MKNNNTFVFLIKFEHKNKIIFNGSAYFDYKNDEFISN